MYFGTPCYGYALNYPLVRKKSEKLTSTGSLWRKEVDEFIRGNLVC